MFFSTKYIIIRYNDLRLSDEAPVNTRHTYTHSNLTLTIQASVSARQILSEVAMR